MLDGFLQLPDFEQELAPQVLNEACFTCFSKLPIELRHMIWERSLPKRRLASLNWINCTSVDLSHFHGGAYPIAFHVCQESRTVVLQHYFVTKHDIEVRTPRGTKVESHDVARFSLINPRHDRLFITQQDLDLRYWTYSDMNSSD